MTTHRETVCMARFGLVAIMTTHQETVCMARFGLVAIMTTHREMVCMARFGPFYAWPRYPAWLSPVA